ncbi:hypothetical protein [Leuconostoc suionicum]|uniref:hypothetical protein n=1 Tax=Leuconostoc suionicum TaxID=1511761 RepID=UPI00233F66E2|nr:hypothetical protein [Leuconostoc suionicum]MDC2804821.1 hypothetical protein [Leuconostoc suionicum]MDC2822333.1 hypothetical protein [Leuconostoc suionicum]
MKKFVKWCDNHKWTYVIAILSFIIVPVWIEYASLLSGQHRIKGDWLSFWGSYLGVIPSGLIAFIVTKYQINNDRLIRKEEDFSTHRLQFQVRTGDAPTDEKMRLYPITPSRFGDFYGRKSKAKIRYGVKPARGKILKNKYINIKNVSDNAAMLIKFDCYWIANNKTLKYGDEPEIKIKSLYCVDRIEPASNPGSDVVLLPSEMVNSTDYRLWRVSIYHLTSKREENKVTFESIDGKSFRFCKKESSNHMFDNKSINDPVFEEYNFNTLPRSLYVHRKKKL